MLGVQLENPSLKLANPDWQVDYLSTEVLNQLTPS